LARADLDVAILTIFGDLEGLLKVCRCIVHISERRDSKALRPTNPPLRHGSVDVKFLYTQ
jgi:hypothetical protein